MKAHLVFDMAAQKAKVDATVLFHSGTEKGNPIFDLRQEINEAYINDTIITSEKMRHHDFGGGSNSELRVLQTIIEPETENVLKLVYELNQPQCPASQPIGWDGTHVYFEFWFSDLYPARYLEMWFPSNLIYDKFKFDLDIEIINTDIDHVLFSNGKKNSINQNHWIVEFPERFTSLSPMLCLIAANRIEHMQEGLSLNDTTELVLDIFKLKSTPIDLTMVEKRIRDYITDNVKNIGPYAHGKEFTAFLWTNTAGRSMEYEGAVTTELAALKHEVFHSWFARALKPASQNDAWMDEGWTVYNTDPNFLPLQTFALSDPPVVLSSSNPFNRITPSNAYQDGSRFFGTIAELVGTDNLRTYMNSFYRENMGLLATTEQLKEYLIEASGINGVTEYFDRFVYGKMNP